MVYAHTYVHTHGICDVLVKSNKPYIHSSVHTAHAYQKMAMYIHMYVYVNVGSSNSTSTSVSIMLMFVSIALISDINRNT